MAIDITFYTFNKKPNSTRQPEGGGVTYKCTLIEPTSFTAPDIALVVPAKPTGYNYAFIPEFSRYYFVTDWAYSAGLWRASLSVDVLASFKDYIGSQRQYVLRSSAKSDGRIVDTMYPTKNSPKTVFSYSPDIDGNGGNPFKSDFANGIYIVGIINSDSGAIGCVSYYVFNNSQFRAFCNTLMGTSGWMYNGIEEIGEELTKVLFNPFQYIASCVWLPVSNIATGGSVGAIPYGWWTLSASASRLGGSSKLAGANFKIPKHPQSERGAYLNGSPFSRYMLSWPCFGQFALDPDIMGVSSNLYAQCFIDPVSGMGTLNIMTEKASLITTQAQVGVPIQIAQMAVNYGGTAGSVINAFANGIVGNIGGALSSIGDAVSNAMPQLTTMGKNGGAGAYMFSPVLNSTFYSVVDEDVEHLGRPLCQDVVPASIPGYMLCADVEIEISGTKPEMENIVSLMESGFYYE